MREKTTKHPAQDSNMPSIFNESITIEEAVRKPMRTNYSKSPQSSRTVSYTNTDSSLSRFAETREAMPPVVTEDSLSSTRSLNSSQQTNRRRERHQSKLSGHPRLTSSPHKRRSALGDQMMISHDLQKSSRTLIKHSSAGSFMGGWSSADLSGRSDTEDNVESSKFKSRQKLRLLMQNIEMEKKKDLVVQGSMHQNMRPLQVGELGHVRRTWRKPDLEDTLPKDARLRRFRLMCGELVEDPRVQFLIITLIVINAIMMGVATFDFVTNDENTNMAFDIADKVFLTMFTIESALQLIYRGPSLFRDRWLVFDFVIVVISWTLESLQVIRAFRIFRALRLITRMVALKSLLMALGEVLPRIYAITSMLVLVFYIYAVLFVELFGDLQLSTDYFNTLPNALLTCMQLMTLEWSETAREVMDYYEWAGMIFCSFISITGFIVFNLIVAVVCDAVSIIDKKIRQEGEEYSEEMKRLEGRDLGLDMDESDRSTAQHKWKKAQKRINELTLELEEMKENQTKLIAAIAKLASVCQGHELLLDRGRKGLTFPSSLGVPKL